MKLVIRLSMALTILLIASSIGSAQSIQNADLTIDHEKIRALGLRVVRGKHITMITDIRQRPDVEQFGAVFDQAVPQWCEYFDVPRERAQGWKTIACVMQEENQKPFLEAGLLPADLPRFPAGYQRDGAIWVFAQAGEYYTRHLLLHEGTHAFMQKFLGGYGPPWYSEGMAELLALHQWKDGQLQLKHRVTDREQVPYWGRVKIIQQDGHNDQSLSLDEVLETPHESFRKVRYYAWAWAACEFLDTHPGCQQTFRTLKHSATLTPGEFNRRLKIQLRELWPALQSQWQSLVDEIEYGYDVGRAQPVAVPNRQIQDDVTELTVSAERGWQKTGLQITAGHKYRFQSSGQYQIKRDAQVWTCQPGGVTIEYYRGRPLGQLIAVIRSDDVAFETIGIGLGGEFRFQQSGELWLRVNESPAHWDDNQGELTVRITGPNGDAR